MKILLFGGTGFVGNVLLKALQDRKHEVTLKDIRRDKGWESDVSKVDVVINIGGTPLFKKRWSYDYKASIYDSRIEANQRIAKVLDRAVQDKPDVHKLFITASAVGYFGSRGDEILTESSERATDFLAKVCADWEEAAFQIKNFNQIRKVAFRLGIVLGSEGGALEQMKIPFQLFVGGPIGNGKQWTSWVHIQDVANAFVWAVENSAAQGVYNLTSPNPVTNLEFSKTLGKILDRPCWLPVPELALRVAVGEAATVLAGGQRVIPKRLQEEGFSFTYPTVEPALKDALLSGLTHFVKT